jgi:aryl-alcohol dehydrogenase-like predicted oxidoreductase
MRRGVLVKKVLASGHLDSGAADPVQASMDLVLSHSACSAAIVGTISEPHLRADVMAARQTLAQLSP